MKYFDLHCDTVSKIFESKTNFNNKELSVNSFNTKLFQKYVQCFSLWQDDKLKGKEAFEYAKSLYEIFDKEIKLFQSESFTPLLTIENASALGGSEEKVDFWKSKGVRMLSLTWNGENDLGYGAMAENKGLKGLGKAVIPVLEKQGIIIDVSHLSEKGFSDMCNIAGEPFVASHSCCFDIKESRRNLKMWQIESIVQRKGLIGLNFYAPFLGDENCDVFEKIYESICYLLNLGADNVIALGSDFDGAELSAELNCAFKVKNLFAFLKYKGLDERVLNKIFYENAYNFFAKNKKLTP